MAAARTRLGANLVGACVENERPIPGNGNIEQRTTNGLLVMRAIDSRFLFIGREQTAIDRDGNGTIVQRPNNQRLDFEGDRQLMKSLQKGGFVIVDDFKLRAFNRGRPGDTAGPLRLRE